MNNKKEDFTSFLFILRLVLLLVTIGLIVNLNNRINQSLAPVETSLETPVIQEGQQIETTVTVLPDPCELETVTCE